MATRAPDQQCKIGQHTAHTKGTVLYVSFDGDFSYSDAKRMLEFVEAQYGTEPYYAICDITHQGTTSPEARRLLTEWTQNKQLRAGAMIGGSLLARTMATLITSAIRAFGKKSIPIVFVPSQREAEAWIKQQQQQQREPH
jgi:hypothetical protein